MQEKQKVLRIVAPSSEQELTKSYNVNTVSFAALCNLLGPLCANNHKVL